MNLLIRNITVMLFVSSVCNLGAMTGCGVADAQGRRSSAVEADTRDRNGSAETKEVGVRRSSTESRVALRPMENVVTAIRTLATKYEEAVKKAKQDVEKDEAINKENNDEYEPLTPQQMANDIFASMQHDVQTAIQALLSAVGSLENKRFIEQFNEKYVPLESAFLLQDPKAEYPETRTFDSAEDIVKVTYDFAKDLRKIAATLEKDFLS